MRNTYIGLVFSFLNEKQSSFANISAYIINNEKPKQKNVFFLYSATNEDEMCNFYLMYYTDNEDPLEMKFCFGPGPPSYYWKDSETGLQNIPDFDASHLDI